MKRILILLTLSSICFTLKAQDVFINQTQSQVISTLQKDTSVIFKEKIEDNGLLTFWFDKKHIPNDDFISIAVHFKKQKCVMYELVDLKSKLSQYIVSLNKAYTKQDADTWVDIAHSRAYILKAFDDGFLGLYVKGL